MGGDHTPLILVRFGSECFGIELFRPVQRISQIFRLMVQVGICTIFGQHQFLMRIFFLQILHPGFDILYFLFIPTEITVHTLNIGNQVNRMLHMSVSVHRNRITVRVFRFSQVMQRLGQFFCILVRLIYLIMQSPHIDRRMIEALADHFTQLVTAILRFLSGHTVYKRYLRPNNQPQAVTTGIQIIGLLIVGKTNGCRTDIHDRSQIEIMVFVLQGTSQPPPVLMTGNTIHRIFLTIQIETFAGNNFIFTQPQRLYHFINHLSVFNQTADNLIQIRIFTSLPQSRFLYRKRRFISLLTLC